MNDSDSVHMLLMCLLCAVLLFWHYLSKICIAGIRLCDFRMWLHILLAMVVVALPA